MKQPTNAFLIELAHALQDAEHGGPASGMAAGMLWAMYPEWYEKVYRPFVKSREETQKCLSK